MCIGLGIPGVTMLPLSSSLHAGHGDACYFPECMQHTCDFLTGDISASVRAKLPNMHH